MRTTIIVISLVFVSLQGFAQDSTWHQSHHELGVSISSLTGYGLHYAYVFDPDYRIVTTLFAYYDEQNTSSYNWIASMGLKLERTFERTSATRFYGFVGGEYYYSRYNYRDRPYSQSAYTV